MLNFDEDSRRESTPAFGTVNQSENSNGFQRPKQMKIDSASINKHVHKKSDQNELDHLLQDLAEEQLLNYKIEPEVIEDKKYIKISHISEINQKCSEDTFLMPDENCCSIKTTKSLRDQNLQNLLHISSLIQNTQIQKKDDQFFDGIQNKQFTFSMIDREPLHILRKNKGDYENSDLLEVFTADKYAPGQKIEDRYLVN